jgi:hypothetical protein
MDGTAFIYCFAVMNRTAVRMKSGRFMESLQQTILGIALRDFFSSNEGCGEPPGLRFQ